MTAPTRHAATREQELAAIVARCWELLDTAKASKRINPATGERLVPTIRTRDLHAALTGGPA